MAGVRCGVIDRCDGCGLRDVQLGSIVATAGVGGYVEQCLVSAFGVCRDQLYEELGLCLFCGGGIVDWRLCFDDFVAEG
jgi:hypothetical protein